MYTTVIDEYRNKAFFPDGEVPTMVNGAPVEIISIGLSWEEAHDWVSDDHPKAHANAGPKLSQRDLQELRGLVRANIRVHDDYIALGEKAQGDPAAAALRAWKRHRARAAKLLKKLS